MGLGFDGPGGATAAMGGAVVRTGIMVESVKGRRLKNEVWECAWDRAERLRAWIGAADRVWDINGILRRGGGMRGTELDEGKKQPNTTKPLSFPDELHVLR
jgi:hypothetical protein